MTLQYCCRVSTQECPLHSTPPSRRVSRPQGAPKHHVVKLWTVVVCACNVQERIILVMPFQVIEARTLCATFVLWYKLLKVRTHTFESGAVYTLYLYHSRQESADATIPRTRDIYRVRTFIQVYDTANIAPTR